MKTFFEHSSALDLTHEVLTHHLDEIPEGRWVDTKGVYFKPKAEPDHEAVMNDLKSIGWRVDDKEERAVHDDLPGHHLNIIRGHADAAEEHYIIAHHIPKHR